MARPFDFGQINLTANGDFPVSSPSHDVPFRIAILSDLGGRPRTKQATQDIANRRVVEIDRDNFEEVFAKFDVGIDLSADPNSPVELRLAEMDDFHPDQIFQHTSRFAKLRDLRARVADPETFPAVAEELGLHVAETVAARSKSATGSSPAVASVASNLSTGSLLDATIEQTEHVQGSRASRSTNELDAFVRRVTESHLVAAADPLQAQTLAMIDRLLSEQMRALLHVPAFQSLEAAWRAVSFLVRRVETASQLKVYLIDISQGELAADLRASQELHSSGVYQLLVGKSVGTLGAEPWTLIVGNYEFGPESEDAELLGRLAKVAKGAGAPLLAAASSRLVGCVSLAETPHPREWLLPANAEGAAAWAGLRALLEVAWIGLALPRFLLRLPYGKKTDPIESFDFEEMAQPPAHDDYLWGNAAFACAVLLVQSFSEDGWTMRPSTHTQIDGLPLHVYEQDGESELKPCAEVLLTEEAAERILDAGIMPLVSLKGQDAVRVVRFQSIAVPLCAIAGRWKS